MTWGGKRFLACAALLAGLSAVFATFASGDAEQDARLSALDPVDAALARTRVELSPDRRWIAVECWQRDGSASSVYLVSIERGTLRTIEGRDAALAPVAWSADGLVRVRRWREGKLAVVRWVEPRSAAVIKTTPDRDWMVQGLAAPAGDGWSSIDRVIGDDGRTFQRIFWAAGERVYDAPAGADTCVVTTAVPGIVFVGERQGQSYRIQRVDMVRGREREIVRVPTLDVQWSVAGDARAIALRAEGLIRVHDAFDGRDLARPWRGEWWKWIEGGGSRWILVSQGGEVMLADLEQGGRCALGPDDRAFRPDVRVIDAGRLLLLQEDQATLFDERGERVRQLFPPSS